MTTNPFPGPPDALRLLVVEDDYVQARTVRRYLTGLGYEVVGVAPNAAEAERLFDATAPDLLLLDVHLAGSSADGIEVAARLTARRRVPLIFLTSFQDADTFGRARQVGPAAFLSKPFDEQGLAYAIELAAEQFARPPAPAPEAPAVPTEAGLAFPDAFWLRDGGRLVRVALADIQWLEADNNYCHLHTDVGRKYTARATLRELADRLPTREFVRVHRSYSVRVAAIESLDPGEGELILRGGPRLPLGRAYRDALLERLTLLP